MLYLIESRKNNKRIMLNGVADNKKDRDKMMKKVEVYMEKNQLTESKGYSVRFVEISVNVTYPEKVG